MPFLCFLNLPHYLTLTPDDLCPTLALDSLLALMCSVSMYFSSLAEAPQSIPRPCPLSPQPPLMKEEDAEARGASKEVVTSLSEVSDPFENLMKATSQVPVKCTHTRNHKISYDCRSCTDLQKSPLMDPE